MNGGDDASKVEWTEVARPVRLSESVAARIEAMIASGQLLPGARLPAERQLAESLGVSRGLVREAIHELALKGLVTRRQGRGTHVRDAYHSEFTTTIVGYLTQEHREVVELLDLREALEPPIAARAAERATAADVERLRRVAAALEQEGDPRRAAELDADFHHAIALATRNEILVKLVETSMEVLHLTRQQNLQTAERRRVSREGHQAVFTAIKRGDAAAAEVAMTEHIRNIAAFVIKTDGDDLDAAEAKTPPVDIGEEGGGR